MDDLGILGGCRILGNLGNLGNHPMLGYPIFRELHLRPPPNEDCGISWVFLEDFTMQVVSNVWHILTHIRTGCWDIMPPMIGCFFRGPSGSTIFFQAARELWPEADLYCGTTTRRTEDSPWVPSGKLTVCYWKWWFIVDLPMKNGDFP